MMFDGTPLPEMQKNMSGTLTFLALHILKEEDRLRLTEEHDVPFLPAGSRLWVKVKADSALDSAKLAHLEIKQPHLEGHHLFLPIVLEEPLILMTRAGKHSKLGEGSIFIPKLGLRAKSVNEAYTRISAAYEPSRRSHAGNVFHEVYYELGSNLRSLDALRSATEMLPRPMAPAAAANPSDSGDLFPPQA
jgi:hypothetical protein